MSYDISKDTLKQSFRVLFVLVDLVKIKSQRCFRWISSFLSTGHRKEPSKKITFTKSFCGKLIAYRRILITDDVKKIRLWKDCNE